MKIAVLFNASLLFALSLLFWAFYDRAPRHEQMDCTMLKGGWHPDIPGEIRRDCKFPKKMT